jgi:uncharacterized protein (DUF427 family)
MNDYPVMIATVNRVEGVQRRIRASLAGKTVLDTIRALYVWEWPNYPQYYIPTTDVRRDLLVDEHRSQSSPFGTAAAYGLRVGDVYRPNAAKIFIESSIDALRDTIRFDWAALDAWFEEDEHVFVHPRNPYVRVDALRSTRRIRVELDGAVLAESSSPIMVFETGLPTRYYFNRTQVNFEHLVPTDTVTECPYKGKTTGYWSVRVGETIYRDLAWAYDFPTREVSPIAGLISFYNERVDIFVDGQKLERPETHFFPSTE